MAFVNLNKLLFTFNLLIIHYLFIPTDASQKRVVVFFAYNQNFKNGIVDIYNNGKRLSCTSFSLDGLSGCPYRNRGRAWPKMTTDRVEQRRCWSLS